MKVKRFSVSLLVVLLTAVLAMTVVGCADRSSPEQPSAEPVAITLQYDETSGLLSWGAVENAEKYTVSVARNGEPTKTQEVTETKTTLILQAGDSHVTVTAYSKEGTELGMGRKIITLTVDIGAPEAPTGLKYDKTSGVLSWNATENAVKYSVSVTSPIGNDVPAAVETGTPECKLDLGKGVYEISVSAISESDAESETSVLSYRSYIDEHFAEQIGETDFYRILDFEEENVLDAARQSDFKEWGELSSCVYAISDTVNTQTTADSDGDGEADISDLGNKMYERVAAASNVLELEQIKNESGNYFAGVTINLQEKIVDFGRLYYDLYRGNWSPAGVMVDDGEGNRVVVTVDYDDSATDFQWATKSITKSAILKSAPNFTGIEEITFYFRNTNGGWIYFDNVKFDKTDLGDIGGLDYSKRDKKFVWDAVESATEYELYIDGAEEPFVTDENEVDMTESPLGEGNHTVKLVAVNGTSRREKIFDSIFVDKDMRFNVPKEGSTTEYILAAFDTTEYLQYLQPYNEQMKPAFDITNEGLELTFNSTYENSSLKYLFPETVDGKDIYKLHIRIKSDEETKCNWYLVNKQGKTLSFSADRDGTANKKILTFTDEGDGWTNIALDMTQLDHVWKGTNDDYTTGYPNNKWGEITCDGLQAIWFSATETGVQVQVGGVFYEKYPSELPQNTLTYKGAAFPSETFADTEFDLTKLAMGLNIPEGRFTATIKNGEGDATDLDLTQTAHTFDEGTYTLTLTLSNSITSATATHEFTVNKARVYMKEDGKTKVLGDFDNEYYLDTVTVKEGGTKQILHHDASQPDEDENGIINGANNGALKLIFPSNWDSGVAWYDIGQTVTLVDSDTVSIRLFAMNCWKTVVLYFPKADGDVYKYACTIKDQWNPNNDVPWQEWCEVKLSKAKLNENGVTSFDRIGFSCGSVDENGNTIYVDEICLVSA